MKIKLTVDKKALPSPHVTRTFYPAGTIVDVQPADNLPATWEARVKESAHG